jgi:PAS domain S-box-containing protein
MPLGGTGGARVDTRTTTGIGAAPITAPSGDPELEGTLSRVLAAARVGIWRYDHIQREQWDATTKALFGLPPEQKPTTELFLACVHPDDRKRYAQAFASAVDPGGSGHYECDFRILHPDTGEERWLSSRGQSEFKNGQFVRLTGAVQDITGQKRSEEAARAGEERVRRILDGLFVFVGMLDLDGTLREVNRAPLDQAGITHADAIGKKFWNCYWWSYDPLVQSELQESIARARVGEIVRYDAVVRVAGGHLITLDFQLAPLRDEQGRVTHLIPSGIDISERKHTEEQLRASEERFRELADNISQFAWMAEGSGSIYWFNKRWFDFTGTTLKDMTGWGWTRTHHPEHVDRVVQKFSAAMRAGEPWEDTFPLRGKDGQYRWFLSRALPIRDAGGKVVRWFGTNTDVTELREAAVSEQRFRSIFEHAATGIALVGLDGEFQQCNPAFANMLGYTQEEIPGLQLRSIVHPDDMPALMEKNDKLLAGEIPSFEVINRYLRKDGSVRWSRRFVSLLQDADGKPQSVMVLASDMTERIAYEQKIGLLLREVNHRAKNMLGVVQAIARSTAASGAEDFQARFAERIRALAAAHDLLVTNDWQGVELADLVASQLAHVGDLIGKRILIAGPPLRISGTAAQTLGMAVHELATNAFKYGALSSAKGTVTINWRTDTDQFAMTWVERGGPPVTQGERPGFGTVVMDRMARMTLGGEVTIDRAAEGLSWRLRCPLTKISPLPFEAE